MINEVFSKCSIFSTTYLFNSAAYYSNENKNIVRHCKKVVVAGFIYSCIYDLIKVHKRLYVECFIIIFLNPFN
jgi:hypothetical protein